MRRIDGTWRELKREENGISLVFVSLSLVVLIGMVAFAVDTGALYQERRELQNGADAAAIAIAEECALAPASCTQTNADGWADSFSDANAGDLASAIDSVTLGLSGFPKTVDVAVSTETTAGGTLFRPLFAQVMGFTGSTVHAEASAEWGFLSGIGTIPLTISFCEWERETANGSDYPAAIPNAPFVGGLHPISAATDSPPFSGAAPHLIKFHTGNNQADDCAAQAGQDTDGDGRLPGGFGWIKDDDGTWDCYVDMESGNWVPVDPGASPTNGCTPAGVKDAIFEKEILIPWFKDSNDLGGANGEYEIFDFVGFYVTGYNFGGHYKEPGSGPCSGSVRCLEGYFKHATTDQGTIGGSGGVIVIRFTG